MGIRASMPRPAPLRLQIRVSRDNLDENGRRQSEFEAAAGSERMIVLIIVVRKGFCRCGF